MSEIVIHTTDHAAASFTLTRWAVSDPENEKVYRQQCDDQQRESEIENRGTTDSTIIRSLINIGFLPTDCAAPSSSRQ
jgi:hypothetical protein